MKSNIHAILYLPDDILNCDPGWVFLQLATERILGEIKPDATSIRQVIWGQIIIKPKS